VILGQPVPKYGTAVVKHNSVDLALGRTQNAADHLPE
jgi:hypothetical protein